MLSRVLHEHVVLTKGREKDIYPHEVSELEYRPGSVTLDEILRQHIGNSRSTFSERWHGVEQGMHLQPDSSAFPLSHLSLVPSRPCSPNFPSVQADIPTNEFSDKEHRVSKCESPRNKGEPSEVMKP